MMTTEQVSVFDRMLNTHPYRGEVVRAKLQRDALLNMYQALTAKTGPLETVIYPAANGDAFPTLLAPNLVMIDAEKLLFDTGPGAIQRYLAGIVGNKDYSDLFQQGLDRLDTCQQTGFDWKYETLPLTLASLFALGVNLAELTVQGGADNCKLSYTLNRQPRSIHYLRHSITPGGARILDRLLASTDLTFRSESTGVLVKADHPKTHRAVIDHLRPRVVIVDRMDEVDADVLAGYSKHQFLGEFEAAVPLAFGYNGRASEVSIYTR